MGASSKRGEPRPQERPELCDFTGCGRPFYAQGLCQTHYRQWRTTGKLEPIRPYRTRTPGTVKYAGMRLSPQCAKKLAERAARAGISQGAAISEVLEEWFAASLKGGDSDG